MPNKENINNQIFPQIGANQNTLTTLLSIPFLPFILFMQLNATLVNSFSKLELPQLTSGQTSQYKNNEEWEIWEDKGKLKVKVHRSAKRE